MPKKEKRIGFKNQVADFLTLIKNQGLKENLPIEENTVVKALIVLNFISYKKIADIFLGCACINLLNKYVKDSSSKLNYQFKRHINNLLKGIEDINQPKTVRVDYDNTEGKAILLISIWDFQFSYKSIRFSKLISLIMSSSKDTFDGIRKQPFAQEIFQFAYENEFISNLTLSNNNLRDFVENEMSHYYNGSYVFEGGKLIKINNLLIAKDTIDKKLRDYFRVKLKDCNRPVIISGVFVKIWEKHVTFIEIEPYIESVKSIVICDHININRRDLEKIMDPNKLIIGERYYLIGFCKPYGDGRMGVNLYFENGVIPIFGIHEFQKMSKDIISICYRFSIEDYMSKVQGKVKM